MQTCFKYCCLILLLSLTTCRGNITVPLTDTPNVLVANCLFHPDSTWQVYVSTSAAIQATDEPPVIEDAIVEIVEKTSNDVTMLTHRGEGLYESLEQPIVGRTYQLSAKTDSYLEIESTIEEVPTTFFARLDTFQLEEKDSIPIVVFDVEIEDAVDKKNYYVIEVKFELTQKDSLPYFPSYLSHFSYDPSSGNQESHQEIFTIGSKYIYLTDDSFNGQIYTTKFGVTTADLKKEQETRRATIEVKSVSPTLYQYYQSANEYFIQQSSEFVIQPIDVYTNMEQGLGIFGGFHQVVLETDF